MPFQRESIRLLSLFGRVFASDYGNAQHLTFCDYLYEAFCRGLSISMH